MSNVTIVWKDTRGNMVPGYGIPQKGDLLIVPQDKADEFIKSGLAKRYRAAQKKGTD